MGTGQLPSLSVPSSIVFDFHCWIGVILGCVFLLYVGCASFREEERKRENMRGGWAYVASEIMKETAAPSSFATIATT